MRSSRIVDQSDVPCAAQKIGSRVIDFRVICLKPIWDRSARVAWTDVKILKIPPTLISELSMLISEEA